MKIYNDDEKLAYELKDVFHGQYSRVVPGLNDAFLRLAEYVEKNFTRKEPDAVQELADKLWEVRQNTVEDLGYTLEFETKSAGHNAVYRALAEYVLGNGASDNPRKIIDNENDEWTLRSNGLYEFAAYPDDEGRRTRNEIKRLFGIVEEIA